MKVLNLALLLFLLTYAVAAQTPQRYAEAPGLAVIKNSWHSKVLAAPGEDPMEPSLERLNEESAINERQNEIARSGASARPGITYIPGTLKTRPTPRPSSPMVAYIFEATIRNTGTKKIRRIVWEYIFLDEGGTRELGYRAFNSKVNISPGKSVKVAGYTRIYVNDAVEANKLNQAAQQLHGKYMEVISIRYIEYADNSIWKRLSK